MSWEPIETAPLDGTEIILAIRGAGSEKHWVHIGWYDRHNTLWPWRFIDSFDVTPTGCCEDEEDDRITVNGAQAQTVTHWMPLPNPPEEV